jgi:hypothetical protein
MAEDPLMYLCIVCHHFSNSTEKPKNKLKDELSKLGKGGGGGGGDRDPLICRFSHFEQLCKTKKSKKINFLKAAFGQILMKKVR